MRGPGQSEARAPSPLRALSRLSGDAYAEEEGCANNIGDFCTLDPKTGKPMRLTLGEKEQLFLEALSVSPPCTACFIAATRLHPSREPARGPLPAALRPMLPRPVPRAVVLL